jgi:hypothetical protein
MKNNKLFIAFAIAAFSSTVMADDEISYSFGAKSWNHQFKSDSTKLETTTSTLLSITARKGDYFVVGAFVLPTTYARDNTDLIIRRDSDLALGWSASPNISLLVGQKRLGARNYDTDALVWENEVINLSYLGANGFKMINESTYFYGQVNSSFKGKSNLTTTKVKLTTYEAGLGYVINKNTQLTGGYRMQKFSADSKVDMSGLTLGFNIGF